MHLPWFDQPPYEGAPDVCSGLLPEETAELGRLAKGRHVLEIGSAYGFSAAAMLHAEPLSLTAIDPLPETHVYDAFCANAPGAALMRTVTQVALPNLLAAGRRFGLIFVDGNHDGPQVLFDVMHAVRLLEPDGTLACHDYLEDCCCPDVRKVIDGLWPGQGRVVGSMWVSS